MLHVIELALLAVAQKELWELEPKVKSYIVKELCKLHQKNKRENHGREMDPESRD
jgi:hypothetical protein